MVVCYNKKSGKAPEKIRAHQLAIRYVEIDVHGSAHEDCTEEVLHSPKVRKTYR